MKPGQDRHLGMTLNLVSRLRHCPKARTLGYSADALNKRRAAACLMEMICSDGGRGLS
jgi:hypothetical protein